MPSPYATAKLFLAAVKDCDSSVIRVLEEGGDIDQIMDDKMSMIDSIMETRRVGVLDKVTLYPPQVFLFPFLKIYLAYENKEISVQTFRAQGLELLKAFRQRATTNIPTSEPGQAQPATIPRQQEKLATIDPAILDSQKPAARRRSSSTAMTEALGSLHVSGSPKPAEPAKNSKRKRESEMSATPAQPKGRSRPAGSQNAVAGSSNTGKSTGSAQKQNPTPPKSGRHVKSTGQINILGCEICSKKEVKCKVRQQTNRTKEGKIPACVGCSKNNKRCRYLVEQKIVNDSDNHPTDTETEVPEAAPVKLPPTRKDKGKAKSRDQDPDEEPAAKRRKVRTIKSSEHVQDDDDSMAVDENSTGKIRRSNQSTAVNPMIRTGPPKGTRLGMVPVIIRPSKSTSKPTSTSDPKPASTSTAQKPASTSAQKPALPVKKTNTTTPLLGPKPTQSNPASGSKVIASEDIVMAGPSNSNQSAVSEKKAKLSSLQAVSRHVHFLAIDNVPPTPAASEPAQDDALETPPLITPLYLTTFFESSDKGRLPVKIPAHTRQQPSSRFSPSNDEPESFYAQVGALESEIGTVDSRLMDVEDFLEAIQKERDVDIKMLQQLESQWNGVFKTQCDRYEEWCNKNTKNIRSLRDFITKLGGETSFNKVRQDATELTKVSFFNQISALETTAETNEKNVKACQKTMQVLQATVDKQSRTIAEQTRFITRLEDACNMLNKCIETMEQEAEKTRDEKSHQLHFEPVLKHLSDRIKSLEDERDTTWDNGENSADETSGTNDTLDNGSDAEMPDADIEDKEITADIQTSTDAPTPAATTTSSLANDIVVVLTPADPNVEESAPTSALTENDWEGGKDIIDFLDEEMAMLDRDADADMELPTEIPHLQIMPPTPTPTAAISVAQTSPTIVPAASSTVQIPSEEHDDMDVNIIPPPAPTTIMPPPAPVLTVATRQRGQSVSMSDARRRSPRLEKKQLPATTPPEDEVDFEPTP